MFWAFGSILGIFSKQKSENILTNVCASGWGSPKSLVENLTLVLFLGKLPLALF